MPTEIIVMIVGLCVSAMSLFFAFWSTRRNERFDNRDAGKSEGTIMADIAHIKSSVDRVEKNISNVDAKYMNIAERLARVEKSVENIQTQIEEQRKQGGE